MRRSVLAEESPVPCAIMNLQLRILLYRFFVQPMLWACAALAVPPRICRTRLNSLFQYFRGLPIAVRALLITATGLVMCTAVTAVVLLVIAFHYIYFDRSDLPEIDTASGCKTGRATVTWIAVAGCERC
jgi:hypothetical protein